jgi:hypothetical protein
MIVLALLLFGLGVAIAKDGQPRTGKYSFGWTVVASCVHCSLLYWGGFFG